MSHLHVNYGDYDDLIDDVLDDKKNLLGMEDSPATPRATLDTALDCRRVSRTERLGASLERF